MGMRGNAHPGDTVTKYLRERMSDSPYPSIDPQKQVERSTHMVIHVHEDMAAVKPPGMPIKILES